MGVVALETYLEPPLREKHPRSCQSPQGLFHHVWVPCIKWLREYKVGDLTWDLQAGLLVGTLLIPQGMAYGVLAGLPPIYGLYCAIVPNIVYAIFGTSRESAVAAMALVSLMVGHTITEVIGAGADMQARVAAAVSLAFLTGIIQIVLGLFNMGNLAIYVSTPVTSGFCTGGEILIAISQLKYLLGIKVPSFPYAYQTLRHIALHLHEVEPHTMGLGFGAVAVLYSISRWRRWQRARNQAPGGGSKLMRNLVLGSNCANFLALIVTTGLSYAMHQAGRPTAVIGKVPRGFHAFLPWDSLGVTSAVLPRACLLAVISFMLTYSVSQKYAALSGYELDASQELVALGAGNVLGSFTGSFPVAGGFARTAVSVDAGARTQLAAVVSAAVVVLSINTLTDSFFFIPLATLAAIVQVAIFGVVDFHQFVLAWRSSKTEFAIMTCTFVVTLAVGIDKGIMAGVALSLLALVRRSSHPSVKVLGVIPGTSTFRDVKRYPHAYQVPTVRIMRVDESLHFASCLAVKEQILQLAAEGGDHMPPIILLDCSGINFIDMSGIRALDQMWTALNRRGQSLYLTNVKAKVRDRLKKLPSLWERLGGDRIYLSLPASVNWLAEEDVVEIDRSKEGKDRRFDDEAEEEDWIEFYI